MKIRYGVIALVLVGAFSQQAIASRWVTLVEAKQPSDDTVSIDESTIVSRNGLIFAWHKSSSQVSKINSQHLAGRPYKSQKERNAYRCATRELVLVQITVYTGENGSGERLFDSTIQPAKYEFESPVPDSFGETLLNYVCRREASSKKNR